MFTLAMWIMLRDRSRRRVNYYMVFAGCALMTLATAVSCHDVISGCH